MRTPNMMRTALPFLVAPFAGCVQALEGDWVVARDVSAISPTEGCDFDYAVHTEPLLVGMRQLGGEALRLEVPLLELEFDLEVEGDILTDESGDVHWELDKGVLVSGIWRMRRPDLSPDCVVEHDVQGWRLERGGRSKLDNRYTLSYGETEPGQSYLETCGAPVPPSEVMELYAADRVYVDLGFIPPAPDASQILAVFPESNRAMLGGRDGMSHQFRDRLSIHAGDYVISRDQHYNFIVDSGERSLFQGEGVLGEPFEECWQKTPFTMEPLGEADTAG